MKHFGDIQQTSCPPSLCQQVGSAQEEEEPRSSHRSRLQPPKVGIPNQSHSQWLTQCRIFVFYLVFLWMVKLLQKTPSHLSNAVNGGKIPPLSQGPAARALQQELSLPQFSPWVMGLPVSFAVVKISNSSLKPKRCCLSQSLSCS